MSAERNFNIRMPMREILTGCCKSTMCMYSLVKLMEALTAKVASCWCKSELLSLSHGRQKKSQHEKLHGQGSRTA